MNRIPVSSSNLSSVGYDPISHILEVEFHGGRIYQYFSVPGSVYQGLLSASSHGRFFHANMRDAYPCTRVQ